VVRADGHRAVASAHSDNHRVDRLTCAIVVALRRRGDGRPDLDRRTSTTTRPRPRHRWDRVELGL